MAKQWLWKNEKTGEVIEHDHWSIPPDKSGDWKRAYALSFGRVEGAGSSRGGYVNQAKKKT